MESKQSKSIRRGWTVFIALAVLTAAEFVVSLTIEDPWPLLTPIALAKAALIVYYFMRVTNIWREEESE